MRDQLLIGGSWLDGADGERITVSDPATGEPIAAVAAGTPADAVRAVDAADVAQRSCGAAAPRDRAEVLRRCWETLLAHRDELARLITAEHGKPLAMRSVRPGWSASTGVRCRIRPLRSAG